MRARVRVSMWQVGVVGVVAETDTYTPASASPNQLRLMTARTEKSIKCCFSPVLFLDGLIRNTLARVLAPVLRG